MVTTKTKAFVLSLLVIVGFSILEQLISGDGVAWFLSLEKPSILIPLNLFYIVAGLCSLLWGFILFRLLVRYFETRSNTYRNSIFLIISVVFFNTLWNYFFMGLESTWNGFLGMLLFLPITLIALANFWKVDKVSFWLFLLYVLWVVYDIIWIYLFWKMNP